MEKDAQSFDFDDIKNFNFTNTLDNQQFLQYDHKKITNRIIIFASSNGIKLLSESKCWQSDGIFLCTKAIYKSLFYIKPKTRRKTLTM